jgi:type IVB pilus formation R64 PilN family outer membrane protein
MSSKANIAWKWNGSSIEVYRFETKNYILSALAGKTTTSANVSMAGSGSSTGGAGTTTASNSNGVVRTSDITTWDDVKAYLMTLTSKDGKIAVMESSGIITVKDTPMVQATVEKAIKELNDNLGKQIYMDVKIFSVAMNDSDNYGLNWNLAWAQAASRYGITLNGNGSGITTSSPISIGTTVTSGPFTGASATMKALSSIGKTTIVNEFTVSTLNGQTTPIGNTTKQDYVKQIKVSITGSGDNVTRSVEVTPDSVYDGINMTVTPKLQKNLDKILLEYSLTLNSIDDMSQTYTDSSGNKVTLPKTSIKNILQRSALRSGQTLVLSGFKQNTAKIQNDGVGSASFQLLGGNRNAANTSQYLVITVTPYVAQE